MPLRHLAWLPLVFLWLTGEAVRADSERAAQLKSALKNADRVVVRARHISSPAEMNAFVVDNRAAVAELVENLDFDDEQSGFHCMCDGDHVINFYAKGQLVGTLSHHHGRSLRWYGGAWEEDSLFTPQAATKWREWFTKNGITVFQKMHDEKVAENQRGKQELNSFLAEFPESVRRLFTVSDNGWVTFTSGPGKSREPSPSARKVAEAFPDKTTLALAICRALGGLNETGGASWSSSSTKEQLALETARLIEPADFEKAVEKSPGDIHAQLGAARLFFFEDFDEKLPRAQAEKFAPQLAMVTFQYDRCRNRDMAARGLGRFSNAETMAVWRKASREEIKPPEDAREGDEEPSLPATACIYLARHGDATAREAISALSAQKLSKPDAAALAIARTYLGEKGAIKPEYFEIESYTIGLGALGALEKLGGRDAVDLVITHGTEHSWGRVRDEAVLTAERMTGKKWAEDENSADTHVEEVKTWWKTEREKFPE